VSGAARIRVIGIGSPFGADRIGWEVAEALRERLAPDPIGVERGNAAGVQIELADRPGVELLHLMDQAREVILVDAILVPGARRARVRWVERAELEACSSSHSSHGLGVAEALALGEVLARLPPRLAVLGIEVDPDADAPAGTVAAGVEMILGALSPRIEAERPQPLVNA